MTTEEREDQKQENEALKSAKEIAKKKSKNKVQKIIWHAVKAAIIPFLLVFVKIIAVVIVVSLVIAMFTSILDGDINGNQAYEEQLKATIRSMNLQAYLRQFSHSSEADSIDSETAESYYQSVKVATSGLELSDQQLFALTAIAYDNLGHLPTRNGYTFKEVYEQGAGSYSINSWQHNRYIWDNWWSYLGGEEPEDIPARDAAFETYVKGIFDFLDSDAGEVFSRKYYIYYTQEQLDRFDYAPDKPVTRTSSNEREIFTYEEKSIFGVGAGNILEAAERIHAIYEDEKWTYSVGSDLYSGNINRSLNNPNKVTCCATYVSCTLYLSGLVSEEEINSISYNSSTAIYRYLKTLDGRFMEIESFDELEPGDIVFMTSDDVPNGIGHTQIYAGNNTWYNAGSTSSIQRANPYSMGENYTVPRFITAIRPL